MLHRAAALLVVVAAGAGCTPDVASTGAGGATSSADVSGTTTGNAAASTGSIATSTSASTGTGAMPFPPCGGITATFDSPDAGWQGSPKFIGGKLELTSANAPEIANTMMHLVAPNECFVSADIGGSVVLLPSGGQIVVGLTDVDGVKWMFSTFNGSDTATGVTSDGVTASIDVSAAPTTLAVVLHADSVYFLAQIGGVWTPIGSTNRKGWMDETVVGALGAAGMGTVARFDNFGLATITVDDLP